MYSMVTVRIFLQELMTAFVTVYFFECSDDLSIMTISCITRAIIYATPI